VNCHSSVLHLFPVQLYKRQALDQQATVSADQEAMAQATTKESSEMEAAPSPSRRKKGGRRKDSTPKAGLNRTRGKVPATAETTTITAVGEHSSKPLTVMNEAKSDMATQPAATTLATVVGLGAGAVALPGMGASLATLAKEEKTVPPRTETMGGIHLVDELPDPILHATAVLPSPPPPPTSGGGRDTYEEDDDDDWTDDDSEDEQSLALDLPDFHS